MALPLENRESTPAARDTAHTHEDLGLSEIHLGNQRLRGKTQCIVVLHTHQEVYFKYCKHYITRMSQDNSFYQERRKTNKQTNR